MSTIQLFQPCRAWKVMELYLIHLLSRYILQNKTILRILALLMCLALDEIISFHYLHCVNLLKHFSFIKSGPRKNVHFLILLLLFIITKDNFFKLHKIFLHWRNSKHMLPNTQSCVTPLKQVQLVQREVLKLSLHGVTITIQLNPTALKFAL